MIQELYRPSTEFAPFEESYLVAWPDLAIPALARSGYSKSCPTVILTHAVGDDQGLTDCSSDESEAEQEAVVARPKSAVPEANPSVLDFFMEVWNRDHQAALLAALAEAQAAATGMLQAIAAATETFISGLIGSPATVLPGIDTAKSTETNPDYDAMDAHVPPEVVLVAEAVLSPVDGELPQLAPVCELTGAEGEASNDSVDISCIMATADNGALENTLVGALDIVNSLVESSEASSIPEIVSGGFWCMENVAVDHNLELSAILAPTGPRDPSLAFITPLPGEYRTPLFFDSIGDHQVMIPLFGSESTLRERELRAISIREINPTRLDFDVPDMTAPRAVEPEDGLTLYMRIFSESSDEEWGEDSEISHSESSESSGQYIAPSSNEDCGETIPAQTSFIIHSWDLNDRVPSSPVALTGECPLDESICVHSAQISPY